MADTVTLELLAKQQAQMLTAMNVFREDMSVMMEILRRIDVSVSSIGTQLTEMHVYNRRTADRVRVLEERGP